MESRWTNRCGKRFKDYEITITTDAGRNWTHVFNTNNNQNVVTGWCGYQGDSPWSYGQCVMGFTVARNSSQTVIFGDYGFCHTTKDGGATWYQAYTDAAYQHSAKAPTPKKQNYRSNGMENTSCWQIVWCNATTLWACYTDIGAIRSIDGGTTWSFNFSAAAVNTTYHAAQGTNGTLYAATSNIHDIYQTSYLQDALLDANDAQGKISYSIDNGLTWSVLHQFNHPVFWITLDPGTTNRAYASVVHYGGGAGAGGVYRCDNLGALSASVWTQLPDPPRTEKHPASLAVLTDGKLVAAYSGRRDAGGTFTPSSGCFIYDPVRNSWTDVTDNGMKYWTRDIVVDPYDISQNTWYAGVYSGWGGAPNGLGGLYKTSNRGATWTRVTGSLLSRVNSCTFSPVNKEELYVATEAQGLWKSSNVNFSTPAFSQVAGYLFSMPERVFFNPYNQNELWVTSFGNGMKMGTLGMTEVERSRDDAHNDISIYPNPFNKSARLRVPGSAVQDGQFKIYNIIGQIVKTVSGIRSNEFQLTRDNLCRGMYFYQLTERNRIISRGKLLIE